MARIGRGVSATINAISNGEEPAMPMNDAIWVLNAVRANVPTHLKNARIRSKSHKRTRVEKGAPSKVIANLV